MNIKIFSLVLLSAAPYAVAQNLTARQLFYKEDAEAKPAPKAVPKAAPPKPSPKAAPKSTAKSDPAPAATSEVPTPAQAIPVVTTAAYTPATEHPLGLRYALAQVVNGVESEVNPSVTFHSGDMVRIKIEGNRDGYLYVIARGSSGNWKPLFPAPDINGGDNHVAAHAAYAIPSSTQAFTFDEQPGEEKLFLIYSAEPIRDMESMIPSLAGKSPAGSPAPAAAVKPPPLITASLAPITDNFVSQMRNSYSRDLVVQTVTPKAPDAQPEAKPENAIYVVNKTGGRLVADVRLEHK